MQRGLVLIGESETARALLREAGEIAAALGVELVALSTITREEYEHDLAALDAIEHLEHVDFEEESGPDLARELGEDLVGEVLAGLDVEVSVVGRLVDEGIGRVVVETAERHDCDHVFLVGHSRSRAADALFGDAARYVVHHFDGSVTVRTE